MSNTQVQINTPTTTTIPLDTPKTIVSLSIGDDDIGGIYTVSLMPSHGTLSLGSDNGITYYPDPIIGTVDMSNLGGEIFSAPPPGSLFIGGSYADINAALATLIFTPEAGYSGPGGFTFMVSDQPEQTGPDTYGPRTSDYEAIALSIGGNQAPQIANLGGDTVAYVEESPPIAVDLDSNALVTDDNANFDGGSLTITLIGRDTGEDLLYFDENVFMYSENDNGFNDVIVDGVVIGEMALEYGTPVDDIAISFNSEATAARVTTLLNALLYVNLDQVDPSEGTRTVRFVLTDSGAPDAQTTTVDSTITVTDTPEINRAPNFDLDSGTPGVDVTRSYTEGAAAIALAPAATSDDPDLTAYNGGSITVAVTGADAGDQLTLVSGGNVTLIAPNAVDVGGSGIVATWTGGTNGNPLVITFLPIGSVATTPEHVVDDIVKAIRYRSISDAPATTRTITFTLNDGGGTDLGGHDTAIATATVNVTAVNDAPSGINADAADILENGSLTLAASDFQFTDPEGHGLSAVVITAVSGGTLYVDSAGDGFGLGDAVSGYPATVTYAQIVDGQVRFVATPGLTGEDAATISFRVRDDGGTANGGIDTDPTANTLTIDITAVNVAPAHSLPGTVATAEDTPVGLNGGVAIDPTPIWIDDADGDTITTTLSATDGSFSAVAFGSALVAGAGTNVLTVTGSAADVNKTVYYTTYNPALDVNGSRAITVTTSDGVASTSDTITVNIVAMPDTPDGADVTRTATEDTPYVFQASDFAFSDSDGDLLAGVRLSSTPLHGKIIDIGGYILSEDITGDGIPDVFLSAPERELNANEEISLSLIAGGYIRYIPAADANGVAADSFTYQVVDDSGTPFSPGTVDPTPNTLTFDITAVDDPAVAVDDSGATVAENGTVTFDVRANDGDVDGPALAVAEIDGHVATVGVAVVLASGASVTLEADGRLTYDPSGQFDYLIDGPTQGATGAVNEQASDSFSYTLAGGGTATVTVTVNGLNTASDELWGDAGNNAITGTTAADYFDLSQGGGDTASGLDGNDLFYFGAAFTAADTVDGGAGTNDQIGLEGNYTGANALVLGASTIANVEVIALLPGFDYDLTTVDANVAAGGTLKVFAGNLGAGDDFTFDGSAETDGKFMVYAGLGIDHVKTGAGDDGIYFGPGKFNPANDRVDGGTGTNDQLALDGHYTLTLDGTAIQNIDVIALLRGATGDLATYDLTVDDTLVGAGQTMTLWGTPVETAMTIDGSGELDGAFRIYGGSAGDTITGSNGNDWIWGGLGADALTGGAGADTFAYTDLLETGILGSDTIYDFATGDRIDLAQIDADAVTTGDQAFHLGATAGHTGDVVLAYDAGSNFTSVSLHVDGDGVADAVINLAGNHLGLGAADFVF